MRGYNVAGYALILAYALACMYFAPSAIGSLDGPADRRGVFRGLLVRRRRVSVVRDPHGHRPSRARLPGLVRQVAHGREQHLRGLREPDHLGQPAPAAPQVLRPRRGSQQAGRRRVLAHALSVPDALQVPQPIWRPTPSSSPGRSASSPNPVFAVVAQVFNLWLLWLAGRRPALRGGDLGDVPGLRAVDQHDPELLDARSAVRLPPATTTSTTTR